MRNRSSTRDRRYTRVLVAGVAAGIAMFGIGAGVARAADGPSEETSTLPAATTPTTPGEQTATAPTGGADGVEPASQSSEADPATAPASAESPATTSTTPTTSSDEPAPSVESTEPETTEPSAPVAAPPAASSPPDVAVGPPVEAPAEPAPTTAEPAATPPPAAAAPESPEPAAPEPPATMQLLAAPMLAAPTLAAPTPPEQPLAPPTPAEGHAAAPVLPLIGPETAGEVIQASSGPALALPSITLPADLTLLFEQTGLQGTASAVTARSQLEPRLTGSPERGPYAIAFLVPSAMRATTTAAPKVATAQAARVEASRPAQSSPEQKRRLPQAPPTHSADGGVGSGSGGGGSVAFVRSTRMDQPTVSPLILIRLGARALHADDVLGLRIERPG